MYSENERSDYVKKTDGLQSYANVNARSNTPEPSRALLAPFISEMFALMWWMLIVGCVTEIDIAYGVDRVLVRIPVHVGNVHRAKTVYDKIAAGKPVQHDGQRAANAAAHSAARGRRHGPRGPDRTRWRARHGHFARVLRVGNGWPPGGPHRADGRENAWRGRPIIVRPFRGQRGPDRAFGRDDGDTLAAHTTAVRERDNGTTAPDHAADGTSSSPHAVGNVYYTLDPVVPYA